MANRWAALRLAPTYKSYDNLYGLSYSVGAQHCVQRRRARLNRVMKQLEPTRAQ